MDYVTPENIDAKTAQWLDDITPFNRRAWRVAPEAAALLVVDCQPFFLQHHPDPAGPPILSRIRRLIDEFRRAGRPVFFTQHIHRADGSDLGMMGAWWASNVMEGTPESELHPALGVRSTDVVLRKNVYSAFTFTDLETRLRGGGVRDVVIAGVMTNLCCETSARDAFCRGFRVFLPADATAAACEELHCASLMNIAYGFGPVLSTADVVDQMSAAAAAGQATS